MEPYLPVFSHRVRLRYAPLICPTALSALHLCAAKTRIFPKNPVFCILQVISGKEYTTKVSKASSFCPVPARQNMNTCCQSIKSFQLLPCSCELKRDIYFQKSPQIIKSKLTKHSSG